MNKILLCVNSDIGRGNSIGFRFGKIAHELQKEGIKFDLIARGNYSKFKVKTPIYKNYLARGLNALFIYLFSNFDFHSFETNLFDNFVLKKLKCSKIDYSLAHIGEVLPKTIAFLKSKGIVVFLDIPIAHEVYVRYLENQGIKMRSEKENYKFIRNLNQAIILSDVIVVPSQFVKESLLLAGFSDKKIVIIPFGADEVINFNENEIKSRLKLRPFTFIFVGGVNYRKGISYLLEAWRKANLPIDSAELLFCGRIHKSVKSEINKYNFSNVHFLGFVDPKKYLRFAHVFVFPTLLEGSAKAVYEAMSFGMPIITTFNAGSIIIDKHDGFIIPIANSDILSEKIRFFYNNIDQALLMGINSYQDIKKYSWNKYAKNLIELYLSK